jgi:hypothetical protein
MSAADLTLGQIGAGLMLAGGAIAAVALIWLGTALVRQPRGAATEAPGALPLDRRWWWFLGAMVAVGVLIRLAGLDAKGLSHPEAYIPGIDLAPGISEPPPRHGFLETLIWHFRSEPHPFGYYLAMWAWTKTFGAGLTSIRMPEAILGSLSLLAVYRVGELAYGRRVGVVAAALLSLHGFHVFWSQVARMYVPGAFLGLVSTWLLLEMRRAAGPKPAAELGYVATNVAGALTVEFFWPLLCTQIVWTVLDQRDDGKPDASRIGYFQALAFILAAPMLSHAWMLSRPEAAPPPSLEFLAGYLSFGFLFHHGAYVEEAPLLPLPIAVVVLVASLYLIRLGLSAPPAEGDAKDPSPAPSMGPLALAAAGVSILMVGLAAIANVRQDELVMLSVVPLVALAIPRAVGSLRRGLARFESVEGLLRRGRHLTGVVPLQAVVPTLLLFAVSFHVALTAPRAFAIFVPYLLIVIAAGVLAVPRRLVVIAVLIVGFGTSAVLLRSVPVSPRDYQGLARAMQAEMQPDDLVFLPPAHWAFTPMSFYLDHRRLVAGNYANALRRDPRSRVWVLSLANEQPTIEMANALAGYRVAGEVTALKAAAVLYAPAP